MATLKMTIETGRITGHEGRYFESASDDGLRATGNGWEVTIRPATKRRPGRIIAHCERMYSDGLAVCHREFRLEDGTLGLSGGNVYGRYAYFRKASFQAFLDEFGITAVKREDPNREFVGFSAYCGRGSAWQNVETDGAVDHDYVDDPGSREYFEAPGANPNLYTGEETHRVSEATWAIVEKKEDYGDNHNYSKILYTTVKDVTSLAPELRKRKEREERVARIVKALGYDDRRFKSMCQMRAFIEELIGDSFPLTAAEMPGEATLEIGYRWDSFLYNGIGFRLNYPNPELEGARFSQLDDIGARIGYSACVIGDSVRLYANNVKLADIQL